MSAEKMSLPELREYLKGAAFVNTNQETYLRLADGTRISFDPAYMFNKSVKYWVATDYDAAHIAEFCGVAGHSMVSLDWLESEEFQSLLGVMLVNAYVKANPIAGKRIGDGLLQHLRPRFVQSI